MLPQIISKKKLLYVAPHLSTGGQPQYLYKQIKHFLNEFEIEVVEINNSGGDSFVVQKNRIKELVTLHTLSDNKQQIVDIINVFQPNIIHFQEIPEFELASNILDIIFSDNRKYFILVTTHSSYTKPSNIIYHPDKYVLVSEWSKKTFENANLEVPLDIWEYPIEEYLIDKENAQKQLGLDPNWKHILNVGLFTSGKNQGEIFTIARQLEKYKIKFHFVGNQAMNFEDYWKPLMQDKPDNCVIWGERNDVGTFYSAVDMFYFSSKLELNPLAIKEAISYKLPSIFRKLHTYLDTYDKNELVTYINDDLELTKEIILKELKPEFNEMAGSSAYLEYKYYHLIRKKPRIKIKHLLTRINDMREVLSIQSIKVLEKYGMDYEQVVNIPYDGFAPSEHCRRPHHISKDNKSGELYSGAGLGWITGRHYGCYLAHRGVLETIDTENYDYTLIFEADALINTGIEEFIEIVNRACFISERDNIPYISFANNPSIQKEKVDDFFSKTAYNQDLTHCYLIPNREKNWWLDRIKDCAWDSADLWYNHVFYNHPRPRYTTNKMYSKQADGYSLLDDKIKIWS